MTPLTDIECALISPEGTSLENILPHAASCHGRVAPNGFSGRGIHDLGLHPVASIAGLPWRAGGFHGHKLPQHKRAKPGSPSS